MRPYWLHLPFSAESCSLGLTVTQMRDVCLAATPASGGTGCVSFLAPEGRFSETNQCMNR
jgi:hypothetical protein